MYRGDEPAFCRSCGARWKAGTRACSACGEPGTAKATGNGRGRALPAFVEQRGLLRALTAFAVLYGAVLVLELFSVWHERTVFLDLVNGIDLPNDVRMGDDDHLWVLLGSLLAYLGVALTFGVWVVRAGRNMRARGILDTREIDEARILWFFVPVVHLYRPLTAIRELWRGSAAQDPAKWRDVRIPWYFTPWWVLWLGSNLLGNAALYTNYEAQSPGELLMGSEFDMGRIVLRLACLPLFLAVVHGVARAQRKHRPRRKRA